MVITRVWAELFGAMKAPRNRRKELYPNERKNKWFDQNLDLFMVKIWSNYGQIWVKKGHFKKMTISSVFSELFGAMRAPWNRRDELNSNKLKKSRLYYFSVKMTFFWPRFDHILTPKWPITIVWTELFGAMRAPRNRRHELNSKTPNFFKKIMFFLNFMGKMTFFDSNLTIIWPYFDHK